MIELIREIRTEAEVVRAHRHLLSQQKRKLSHLLRAGEAGICNCCVASSRTKPLPVYHSGKIARLKY